MSVELLSPAGNFEKMKSAIDFGADAVYLAGGSFGLRAKAGNFTLSELDEAFKYLHARGKKGYVTVNAYLKNNEFSGLAAYLADLADINPDAVIVSDPGVFRTIKKLGIKIPIHISTQANVTNIQAVEFWGDLGAERVVMAREVSRDELAYICKNSTVEIECFVHGAMCISMSGRCLISNYMTGRDANAGACTHPCRWKYNLVEEKRPGESYPVEEDERGTYFFNSKDLCLLDHIGDLVDMGVKSFKIEGRMKSIMYAACATGVYRQALDKAVKDPKGYTADKQWYKELTNITHRAYTTAGFGGEIDEKSMIYEYSSYNRGTDFLGLIVAEENGLLDIDVRLKFEKGQTLIMLSPDMKEREFVLEELYDAKGEPADFTKPSSVYKIKCGFIPEKGSILRRVIEDYGSETSISDSCCNS